jgi:hypothetical protein
LPIDIPAKHVAVCDEAIGEEGEDESILEMARKLDMRASYLYEGLEAGGMWLARDMAIERVTQACLDGDEHVYLGQVIDIIPSPLGPEETMEMLREEHPPPWPIIPSWLRRMD